jgi:hypothetical protein
MINIKRYVSDNVVPGRTIITCPQCLEETSFYNWLQRDCEGCGFEWGNIYLLFGDVKVRRRYFTDGEIE